MLGGCDMGTVVEFKRQVTAPAKPADPPIQDLRYVSLGKFDELTRQFSDPGVSKDDVLEYFDKWRVHWGLEPLMPGGALEN